MVATAKGFLALGLSPFGGVGILTPNCPEWFFSGLGAVFAGGLSVGVYNTSSPEMVSYIGEVELDAQMFLKLYLCLAFRHVF